MLSRITNIRLLTSVLVSDDLTPPFFHISSRNCITYIIINFILLLLVLLLFILQLLILLLLILVFILLFILLLDCYCCYCLYHLNDYLYYY